MVVVPLKEYPIETTKPVTPGVSRSDVEQPYSMLAKTLTQFGEAADATAVSLAEQAGAQAVTRDANGDVVVQKAAFIGPAAHVYDKQARMAALVNFDGDAQRKDIELRTQFHDNPQGYREASDQFAKDMEAKATAAGGPEVGLGVRKVIERTSTQTYRGLLNEKESLDLKRDDATMTAGVSSARDDLMAMARGGVTAGADWNAATDKYNTLVEQRVANPRMAYPRAQADFDKEQFHGELQAQGFLHRIDQAYKDAPTRAEGAKTALEQAQSILSDPSVKLSPTQREAYYHKAVGEVRANEAIRKQDIGEARLASQSLQMAISLGIPVTPDEAQGVINMHEAVGDQAGAARLQAVLIRKGLGGDEFNKLPAAERAAQLNAVRGQAAAKTAYDFFTGRGYTPAQASGIVGNLIHESGLDPGAIGDQGTSVGLAQFHNERATALRDFAKSRGTSPGDFNTQLEFIDKELRSTEGRAFGALQAAATPEQAAAAFVHYERPRGYDPNNPAASLGYGSRVAQAKAVFGGQGNVDTGTVAGSAWLQMSRAVALNKDAWGQWKQIKEDYKTEKIRPPDRVINALRQSAMATGDSALLEDIAKKGDEISAVEDFAQNSSLPGQAAQITEMHRLGAERGLEPGQQALLKDFEQRHAAIENGLKENPVATAVANFGNRFKAPPPLNVTDDKQLAAGLGYRGRIAQFAAQNWQTGPVSALDKADTAQVKAALGAADPAGKMQIFNAIATALPEDVRNATLAKLSKDDPAMMVSAAASTMMREAPDVAQSILRGQNALNADPRYSPEKEDKVAYSSELEKRMPASAFTLAGRTDPTGPYTAASSMVKARYADLAAQANDTSGKLDTTRLQKAVDDVTGGVLDHNGGKLIAPARGMSQRQFDGVVWGLNDADLAGASTLSGQAVNTGYLRGAAQLESIGNGRYFLRLGKDSSNPIYAYRYANTEAPQKFILDLRNRPSVPVPRAQLGDVGQTP
jgi:hypothetical protein